MMRINNVDFDFDILDADAMERYETALLTLDEKMSAISVLDFEKASEKIRYQCHLIFDFLNAIFGEGADRKLFGEKTNLGACLDVLDKVINEAINQQNAYESRWQTYSPERVKR